MSSNYMEQDQSEKVHATETFAWDGSYDHGPAEGTRPDNERPCHRCHATGLVEVHGQETDCMDCEGYGTVLI